MTAVTHDDLATAVATASDGPRPIVDIDNVSKRFGNGTLAIAKASLSLLAGEFVSVLGPSGCGKSTLLRLVAGLGAPSTGTIRWAEPAGGDGSHRSEIGFVFQEPTLMPWATALGNVTTPLKLKGVPKAEGKDRAMDMLKRVGLERFATSYPRELSGGMRMRVSIARALVTEPRLLLMDEPFAALDEITRNKLNDDLLALWQAQKFTTVFVTHSVFESVYLSQRIIVMAAHPGRTFGEIGIDPRRTRDAEFRTSSDYAELCRKVSTMLQGAMVA